MYIYTPPKLLSDAYCDVSETLVSVNNDYFPRSIMDILH